MVVLVAQESMVALVAQEALVSRTGRHLQRYDRGRRLVVGLVSLFSLSFPSKILLFFNPGFDFMNIGIIRSGNPLIIE